MSKTVDHPSHYNRGGIEVIDAIEYLEKARWYLDHEIAQRKRGMLNVSKNR